MNIAGTEYELNNKALSIFISGCDGACEGCHNECLWDYNVGRDWVLYSKSIRRYLSSSIVDRVWVMGGEPLLQDTKTLELLLIYLKQFNKEIWLWTRFYEDDVPHDIRKHLDYIKLGEFDKNLKKYIEPLFNIELASSNQKIIKA